MKSNGGAMLAGAAADAPIQTVMSGPAGGMIADGARGVAGSASPTCSRSTWAAPARTSAILVGGAQRHTTEYEIEWGLPAAVPLIDIKSIGAGGGSIAWVDAGGFLRVGPRSAGAEPGPICYGRGGTEVTVTDANLLLGRLDPDYFLGGRMRLDPSTVSGRDGGARRDDAGWTRSSSPRRSSRSRTRTWRARSRWSRSSAATTRAVSSLLAFGGAGPLHAAAVARAARHPEGDRPAVPGVFSALGLLLADIRVDKIWTQAFRSNDVDAALVNRQFGRITERAVAELRREGFAGEPEIRRAINMRYFGQNYEHEVEIEAGVLDEAALRARVPPRSTSSTPSGTATRSKAR